MLDKIKQTDIHPGFHLMDYFVDITNDYSGLMQIELK